MTSNEIQPVSRGSDDLVKLVARLYHIDGLGQSEVAEIAGISRSQVSRVLTRARETGIVRISVEEYQARSRELEDDLVVSFGLKHAIVVRTAPDAAAESVRRTVGYFAVPFVSELIRPGTVLGVAGGRTIYELVRHLMPTNGAEGVTVVQLMGNIGASVNNTDAIEICRTLAHCLNGLFYTVNSPAFAADARSRDIFLAHQDVRAVWQLFGAMHIAMVGIGTLRDSSFIARGALSQSDIELLQAQGAVGEICGRFFDSQGRECDTDFRDRVMSIGLDELAQKENVIGVTQGAGRAEAIRAALSGGLIKSLVIDEAGATAVLAQAGGPAR